MSDDTNGRLVGLAFAAVLAPIWFVVAHFTNDTRGFVVFCVSGVFLTAGYVQRKQPKRQLLWALISLMYAVELALALFVPLPPTIHGYVMIPVSFADLFLVLGLVSLVQRRESLRAK